MSALQKWGDLTKHRSIYLSKTAWDVLDLVCKEEEMARGEVLLKAFLAMYGREDDVKCPGSLKTKKPVDEKGNWDETFYEDDQDWVSWTPTITKFDEKGVQSMPKDCERGTEVVIVTKEGTEVSGKVEDFDWSECPGMPGMKLSKRYSLQIVKYKKIT